MRRVLPAFFGLAALLALVVASGPRAGMSPTVTRDTGLSNDFSGRMGGTDALRLAMSGYPLYFNINFEGSSSIAAYDPDANQWYRDQAANDLLIWNVWAMIDSDAAWDAAFDSVRFYNPTIPIMCYINVFAARDDWEDNDSFPHLRDFRQALEDNDLWLKSILFQQNGSVPGTYNLPNPYFPAIPIQKNEAVADTVATHYLDALVAEGNFHKWTGFFLDFIDYPDPNTWSTTLARDSIDIDRDGTGYSSDGDEQALFKAYYDTLLVKLTAGLTAARGFNDFVLMSNGPGASNAAMAPFLNYVFYEQVQINGTKAIANWLTYFNTTPGILNSTRTNKSFGFYEADVDSGFYTMEALAMIGLGASNTWHGSGQGRKGGPPLRKLTHNFGNPVGDATVVAFESSPDSAVATRVFQNGTVRVMLPTHSAAEAVPWQYLIVTSDGDTLSKSGINAGSDFRAVP